IRGATLERHRGNEASARPVAKADRSAGLKGVRTTLKRGRGYGQALCSKNFPAAPRRCGVRQNIWPQGGVGFLYFSPLFVQDRFEGLIAAVLRVDLLLRSISVPGEAPDFYLTLRENNQAIFSNLPAGSRELEEWRQSAMVTVKNSAWELSVIPSAR